ncbi:MAG: hypothetical protein J7L14_03820 [Candidatus Diapherotrites archaeon]|nr:hypothetical protein [Candidatus Diapherotrites archaeon]
MARITLAYQLTASAAGSGTAQIYQVPSAKKLTITKVRVVGTPGTEGQLKIAIRRGQLNVVPSKGYIYPGEAPIRLDCEVVFDSGDVVGVYYVNDDPTNPHTCWIYLEGTLETERGGS